MNRHHFKQPIGIFDSGIGGLTIMNEIIKKLPEYDYIYLGDNARTPYGTRSFDVVYRFTLQAVKALFSRGCHLIIIACNTASAKALRTIQQKDLPLLNPTKRVLGVIRPTTERIDQFTKTNHIGILGTLGTVNSNSYVIEIEKFHPGIHVTQEACPLWVPLVENNLFNTPGGEYFIRHHIKNILKRDDLIDTLLLACTHYPLLADKIRKIVPKHVQTLTQGEIVAESLIIYLKNHPEIEKNCSKGGNRQYFTTENPELFNSKTGNFMSHHISAEFYNLPDN